MKSFHYSYYCSKGDRRPENRSKAMSTMWKACLLLIIIHLPRKNKKKFIKLRICMTGLMNFGFVVVV